MPIVRNEQSVLESIIPLDHPKHPRLPYNRFPKSGKAGLVVTAGRVVYITGKYLYKYHRKALFASVGLSAGLFTGDTILKRAPIRKRSPSNTTFSQAHLGYRGRTRYEHSRDHRCCNHCC